MSEQFAKLSFEFFPPKDDAGLAKLLDTAKQLAGYGPEFFSVTFGAGGSTQQHTLDNVKAVMEATNVPTAPHISCISSTKVRILDMLQTYQEAGITRLVALRGDIPSGMVDYGEFAYANELVEFIREQTGSHFHLSVAGYPEYHPQANSPLDDLSHFMHKCKAAANQAITQYFYNPDAYFILWIHVERMAWKRLLSQALCQLPTIGTLLRYVQSGNSPLDPRTLGVL